MKFCFSKLLLLLVLGSFLIPLTVSGIEISNPLEYDTFEKLIESLINFIFGLAIAVAPIMFIIAGFLFLTAAGNPERIDRAKKMIWYTVIGLAIVLLSRALIEVIREIIGG